MDIGKVNIELTSCGTIMLMYKDSVLDVIAKRMIYRNFGLTEKSDTYTLCLAVEGGGMRGIISSGMLMALKDLKVLDIFDAYVGVSAGGLNLAYILAGQGPLGLSVYFDEMTKAENLSLKRARNKERPILDMRAIYNKALKREPLNTTELRSNYRKTLHIAVSNVSADSGELISPASAGDRFEEYLVAGATVPVVSGEPWTINNQAYYDGGLYYIDPSQAALQLGATHTLVLNTTYEGFELKSKSLVIDYIVRKLSEQYAPAAESYKRALHEASLVYNLLPWGETELNGMRLYRHALQAKGEVGRITTDPTKLMGGVKAGYQSVLDLLATDMKTALVPTIMH